MDQTFGQRLQAARRRAGYKSQQALGDVIGVAGRTIRNYETDATTPDLVTLENLRRVLGNFDIEGGDPVEAAVKSSRLTEDRQYVVLSVYKKQLREQDYEDEERGRSA